MTLNEAKDRIAIMNGERSWNDWGRRMSEPYGHSIPEIHMDEAAELYARSKWDEACEAQKKICSDVLNDWEFGGRSTVHHFSISPNAEFKP